MKSNMTWDMRSDSQSSKANSSLVLCRHYLSLRIRLLKFWFQNGAVLVFAKKINGSAQLVYQPQYLLGYLVCMYTTSSFQASSLVDQQRAGEMIAAKNDEQSSCLVPAVAV